MKKFFFAWITTVALVTGFAFRALADTQTTSAAAPSGGNQLMQNQTHWYQKAAGTVGPADSDSKGGLVLQPGSVLYLEGDSTLHKYQMNANVILGSAALKSSTKDMVTSLKKDGIDSMTLVVPVNKLKSRESGLDNNAYTALQAKDNPSIKFELESETLKDSVMTAEGNLTIAGATAPVTLSAETDIKGNQIHLKGVQKLKMSDYKVKPPSISLLVTSITCTDEIEIYYDVVFAPATK